MAFTNTETQTWVDDGRETEGGPIMQKTRREWYEYFFTRTLNF